MGKKSTTVEVSARIAEIQKLLLDGYTRSHIIQVGSKWQISTRQIDDYIQQAYFVLNELNLISMKQNLSTVTANLWDLYREARRDDDKKTALATLQQICKIRGLDQNVINHVIEDKRDLETLSDTDLDKLIESENRSDH